MYYQPRTRRPEKSFPLADDFFPQPLLLSQQRLAALRAEASRELQATLDECHAYQKARGTYLVNALPWRAHVEVDGLSEYTRKHRTRRNTTESRVFGTVKGNYHDLAQFFHSDTRADYYNVEKKLHRDTIDAAVLYNVPLGAEASPLAYEGVKWAAYEPFSLRFRMDSCHFEAAGTGLDAHGRSYAYRIILPTAFPEVPDLFKTKRSVRLHCKSVMILMPSERSADATELFMMMENDFRSNRVPRSLYKRYLLNLHKIHAHVETGGHSASRYVLSRDGWVVDHPHDTCAVCTRAFSMLRSKRRCGVCDDVVCRKCLVKSSEILQVIPLKRDKKSVSRLCTPCVRLLREDQAHDAAVTPSDEPDDIWSKTPGIHEPLRMSETPTEASYADIAASFRSGQRLSTTSSHSSYESVTTPTATSVLMRPSFSSYSHRLSSASSASEHSRASMVSLTSPIAVVGAPNEEIEYIDDDDVIYEEDPEMLSQRSAVEVTIDTSDMERESDRDKSRAASVASVASDSSMLQSISSSLHEQELLLRQLQAAADRMRRETRGASVTAQ